MTRKEHEALAEKAVVALGACLPPGIQVVVAVTTWTGEWVGVASNVESERTLAILDSALQGPAPEVDDRGAT